MRLLSTLALLFSIRPTVAQPVKSSAPPAIINEEFSLIVIKATSNIQFLHIYLMDGGLYIGKSSGLRLRLENGKLSTIDRKQQVYVGQNRTFVLGDTGLNSFLKNSDYLIMQNEGFFACPQANGRVALGLYCENGQSIALKTLEVTNFAKLGESSPKRTKRLDSERVEIGKAAEENLVLAADDYDSKPGQNIRFGIKTPRPGSVYRFSLLWKVEALHARSFSVGGDVGHAILFELLKDGTLIDSDGQGIYVDPITGIVGNTFGNRPTPAFSIRGGRLTLFNKSLWLACMVNDDYKLGYGTCPGNKKGTPLILRVAHPRIVA